MARPRDLLRSLILGATSAQAKTKSATSTLPFVSGLTSSAQMELTAPTTVPTSMETPNPTP